MMSVILLITTRAELFMPMPYTIQSTCPETFMSVQESAISFVERVFQDFATWGRSEVATSPPAINPIVSMLDHM